MFGSVLSWCGVFIVSGCSLLFMMCCISVGLMLVDMIFIWLFSVFVNCWLLFLYGMSVIFICVCDLICFSVRCFIVFRLDVDQWIELGLLCDWFSMLVKFLFVNVGVFSRIIGVYMILVMGVMFFCGLYGSLLKCGFSVSGFIDEKFSVQLLGGVLVMVFMLMLLLVLVWFFIIMGWLSCVDSFLFSVCVMLFEMLLVGYVMMMWIGLIGQFCVCVGIVVSSGMLVYSSMVEVIRWWWVVCVEVMV